MTDTPETSLYATLAEVIKSNNSPAMQKAREAIAYRVALSGDVAPARIPAPRNITEVGGYLNLLQQLDQPDLTTQSLAAALGVAGPVSSLFDPGVAPSLFFRSAPNDRPPGPQQPSYLLTYAARSDFAESLAAALAELKAYGAGLPLMMPAPELPTADAGAIAPEQIMALIGRRLRVAPSAALNDVAGDPVLIARKAEAAEWRLMARVLDPTAPRAAEAESGGWQAWQCDAAVCSEVTLDDAALVDVAPILEGAGWYRQAPITPLASPDQAAGWQWFENVTGLIAGETSLGEELFRAFDRSAVAASRLRTLVDRIWNGSVFA